MSLATQVNNLATRIGTEFKTRVGSLAALTTTDKSSTVAAINEVNAKPTGPAINDTTPSNTSVYSSSKTNSVVNTAVSNLINGAPATFDTFKEVADYIASDQTGAANMTAAIANRVRVDAAQGLNSTQQAQGRSNIGAAAAADLGDPETDFVATFNSALT